MKKRFLIFATLLCICAAMLILPAHGAELELRGVWVSTVYNLDWPSAPGLSAAQLQAEADAVVENAKRWGMNAIFLQVRPCGDALYASETEPWSQWLSGAQGQSPDGDFDPLSYFLQICHENGLQLHAWINPYRLTRKAADSREAAFAQLCSEHPAWQMEHCVVFHTDGCLYYDPGRPEVQQMLLELCEELLENYPVDGLHLDDYFYPGSDFDDAETCRLYGQGFENAADFRRESVTQLVAALKELTHRVRPDAVFGISPAGIWATSDSHTLGADTRGSQSYFDHYADSRRWVRENLVDYIIPQIYWEIGASAGEYQTMLDWWCGVAQDTEVKLYIGLAAYKSAQADSDSLWYGSDELLRQLSRIELSDVACGAVFFRYRSILGQAAEEELQQTLSQWSENEAREPVHYAGELGDNAVRFGETVDLTWNAPAGSRVTAFWGNQWCRLLPGEKEAYTGRLSLEAAYNEASAQAPVLFCTRRNGVLSVKLSSYTLTAVRTEETELTAVSCTDTPEGAYQLSFSFTEPCAAKVQYSGDVIGVTLENCTGQPPEVQADWLKHSSALSMENEIFYRLVLPDTGKRRSVWVTWKENSVTITVTEK